MIRYCFFIAILLLPSLNFAQEKTEDCLILAEGFIVKIQQKGYSYATEMSVDYFYFTENPIIEKTTTPIELYLNGGRMLNISYYRSKNAERTFTKNYNEFDRTGAAIEKVEGEIFVIEIYRVLMAYSERVYPLEDITSIRETSHSYSYLRKLPIEELKKDIPIIYPELIDAW